MARLLNHGNNRAIHDSLLQALLNHVLLVRLCVDAVQELRIDIVLRIQSLQVTNIIQVVAISEPLLVIDMPILCSHVLHD